MQLKTMAGLLATLALSPVSGLAGQADSGLQVKAVRFYRPDSRQTRVTAFIEIPFALMQPTEAGASGQLVYRVTVQVLDSTGLSLEKSAWTARAPAAARVPGATTIEMLEFGLAPGRYRLDVAVEDSVSNRRLATGAELMAYRDQPLASDLLLSPRMRVASGSDTAAQIGEHRRGSTFFTPATRLQLTPLRSKAYYLLEAYSAQDKPGNMSVTLTDSTGRVLVRTPPTPVQVVAGGSVLKGQLDLAGLPEGRFNLTVGLALGQDSVQRTEPLEMAGLQETLERVAATPADRVSDEGFFGSMTEAQLDSAEAPLIYIAESGELSVYKRGLSVDAKRKFLTQFWQKRDPTKGTPRNEVRDQFYAAIAHANMAYREGGRRATPGWRTDRGRIYARNGEPSEVLDRRSAGKAPPYQVWRYTRGRSRYYVFVDRTGFGAYNLVATDDLRETGSPGWKEMLGPDALQDVGRFLNIDFFGNLGR